MLFKMDLQDDYEITPLLSPLKLDQPLKQLGIRSEPMEKTNYRQAAQEAAQEGAARIPIEVSIQINKVLHEIKRNQTNEEPNLDVQWDGPWSPSDQSWSSDPSDPDNERANPQFAHTYPSPNSSETMVDSTDSWDPSEPSSLPPSTWDTSPDVSPSLSTIPISGSPYTPRYPTPSDSSSEMSLSSSSDDEDWTSPGGPRLVTRQPIPSKAWGWSTPMMTFKGDSGRPPHPSQCGAFPGEGYKYNEPGFNDFYKYMIPSPLTDEEVVAPFVKFDLKGSYPTVSATWGLGYPVFTKLLRASPAPYVVFPLTEAQLRIFSYKQPFSSAIGKVIDQMDAIDIKASMAQHRYYEIKRENIQIEMKELEDKLQVLQDKDTLYKDALDGVLVDLILADSFGRIRAHYGWLEEELIEDAHAEKALKEVFKGHSLTQTHIKSVSQVGRTDMFCKYHSWGNHVTIQCDKFKRCRHCLKLGHVRAYCPERTKGTSKSFNQGQLPRFNPDLPNSAQRRKHHH
jgi:hypothetical protein